MATTATEILFKQEEVMMRLKPYFDLARTEIVDIFWSNSKFQRFTRTGKFYATPWTDDMRQMLEDIRPWLR